MMAARGITISNSTILRWVQRYVPEFELRWGRFARRVHSSWRMDETAVSVRGGAHYLYRAVDKHGKTVDSLLCTDRSESAARAFFGNALKTNKATYLTAIRQCTRTQCSHADREQGGEHQAAAHCTKGLRRRGLVFAGDAERRAVLAVRLSLCGQAQDPFFGYLSRRSS
jgi:transposase-like protein